MDHRLLKEKQILGCERTLEEFSVSSIVYGGTSTFFIFMAPLAL